VGFVIMPNHLHLLVYLGGSDHIINTVLANGKRFMAYEIVKRLEKIDRDDLLFILAGKVTAEERKRKKKHRVFEISSDIKPCYTEKFLLQKLEYIHANPLKEKWHLAGIPEDYSHSSARFYELNERHPGVALTHYQELM
jgi:REP element-mobilizing transposase RayT